MVGFSTRLLSSRLCRVQRLIGFGFSVLSVPKRYLSPTGFQGDGDGGGGESWSRMKIGKVGKIGKGSGWLMIIFRVELRQC